MYENYQSHFSALIFILLIAGWNGKVFGPIWLELNQLILNFDVDVDWKVNVKNVPSGSMYYKAFYRLLNFEWQMAFMRQSINSLYRDTHGYHAHMHKSAFIFAGRGLLCCTFLLGLLRWRLKHSRWKSCKISYFVKMTAKRASMNNW